MIFDRNRYTNPSHLYWKSLNGHHRINELYSLLQKSMARGDERLAIYAVDQIGINRCSLIKFQILIFICEYCPNIHVLNEFFNSHVSDEISLKSWVIRLCRMTKTRIVVNAFRVASFDQYKEQSSSPSFSNVKYLYPVPPNNPTASNITIDEEKTLLMNTYLIWKFICRDGIKPTIHNIVNSIQLYPKLLSNVYEYLNHRHLDVIFIFLAYTSLSFATSLEYKHLDNIGNFNYHDDVITPLPDYIYDFTVLKPIDSSVEFFLNNMVLSPSTNQLKTDQFGIAKFKSINQSLETALIEYVPTKDVPTIELARFKHTPNDLALYSTHKRRRIYKSIIYLHKLTQRQTMNQYLLADYLRNKLGFPFLDRKIIKHNGVYYMTQKNIFPIIYDEHFYKNKANQTIYKYNINSFRPTDITLYSDDSEILIKIFKMIIFHCAIGFQSIQLNSIIIHNGEVYSLNDRVMLRYSKTVFYKNVSTQTAEQFKSLLRTYQRQILKVISKFYKIITSDRLLNINQKVQILYHLKRLSNLDNWIFYDTDNENTLLL